MNVDAIQLFLPIKRIIPASNVRLLSLLGIFSPPNPPGGRLNLYSHFETPAIDQA